MAADERGSQIRYYLADFKRAVDIINEIEKHNGTEAYINYLAQLHEEKIDRLFKEIARYKVQIIHCGSLECNGTAQAS